MLGKGVGVFGDNIILSKWFNIAWLWRDNVAGTDVDAGIVIDTDGVVDIDCNVENSLDVCVEPPPEVNAEAVVETTSDFDSGADVEINPGVVFLDEDDELYTPGNEFDTSEFEPGEVEQRLE